MQQNEAVNNEAVNSEALENKVLDSEVLKQKSSPQEATPVPATSPPQEIRPTETKKHWFWKLFAGKSQPSKAEQQRIRLEELRHDLFQKPVGSMPSDYALNTLLNMLRIEMDDSRLAVACALSDAPPPNHMAEVPVFATRLCHHLTATPHDPLIVPKLSPPDSSLSNGWMGEILVAILTETFVALKPFLWSHASSSPGKIGHQSPAKQLTPLNDTNESTNPDTIPQTNHQINHQTGYQTNEAPLNSAILYRETDICRDGLRLGTRLRDPRLVDITLRYLRHLTPDLVRQPGVLGQRATELRGHASHLLASLPPDDLYPLWVTLGGPNSEARRDLLPVLDYLTDPRAIPYLTRLLERQAQWTDGNLVGWAVVRSFQRIGDRRALPVLRRLLSEAEMRANAPAYASHTIRTSAELIQATRHAIESIEQERHTPERQVLLRPSQPLNHELLRPSENTPTSQSDTSELLRPEE